MQVTFAGPCSTAGKTWHGLHAKTECWQRNDAVHAPTLCMCSCRAAGDCGKVLSARTARVQPSPAFCLATHQRRLEQALKKRSRSGSRSEGSVYTARRHDTGRASQDQPVRGRQALCSLFQYSSAQLSHMYIHLQRRGIRTLRLAQPAGVVG